ncbi:unnamed protein product [Ranitomeya imitator]|uniref:Uncharacterized protein n=1 Tax=Ranitomeya imitator TaxID=111125 RepID=A0ABN9LSE5_9NEOB|nr:unnamed protein product [Ranitomeya imitator]
MSGTLYRKTSQLLDTLQQMSANSKVVDITHKKGGNPATQLLEQTARLQTLSDTQSTSSRMKVLKETVSQSPEPTS